MGPSGRFQVFGGHALEGDDGKPVFPISLSDLAASERSSSAMGSLCDVLCHFGLIAMQPKVRG